MKNSFVFCTFDSSTSRHINLDAYDVDFWHSSEKLLAQSRVREIQSFYSERLYREFTREVIVFLWYAF